MFHGVESNIYAVVLGSQGVEDIAIAQRAEVRTLDSKQSQSRRKQRKVSVTHISLLGLFDYSKDNI